MAKPDIRNLGNCTADAKQAALDPNVGPPEPNQYHVLLGRLQTARAKIPPLYIDTAFDPYVQTLVQIGEDGFNQILIQDPDREGAAGLMLDIAQAFLQRGDGFEPAALGAFEEVVSDLYDGFLSAEDRRGVAPPDRETLPPLVKFGNPDAGPYTWPADATGNFGMKVAVVNLPPANAHHGLLAWPALGHETAGHDILHADIGLLPEVADAVRAGLTADASTKALASYWADRIDETASDVLGILNMGPSPAIGLIGFFRGLSGAAGEPPVLRSSGPAADPHPADILRGFLGAATVRQLEFSQAADWADVILAETQKDVAKIVLAGATVTVAAAKKSAEIVSKVIVSHPMRALESHAFGEIQNWRDADETIVQQLRPSLTTASKIPTSFTAGVFAAHLVAAATTSALAQGANIAVIFRRMIEGLKTMNGKNPSFGPLRVRHPGNLVRDRAYIPDVDGKVA